MHATESSRREERYPAQVCEMARRCDGRCATAPSGSDDGEITHPHLGDVITHRDLDQLGVGQPDVDDTIEHGDGRWGGTTLTHAILDLASDSEILGPGKAMTDDGRFQCHDGLVRVERSANIGVDLDRSLIPSHARTVVLARGRMSPCVANS